MLKLLKLTISYFQRSQTNVWIFYREVLALIHENGGQVYLDGANMNAQVSVISYQEVALYRNLDYCTWLHITNSNLGCYVILFCQILNSRHVFQGVKIFTLKLS